MSFLLKKTQRNRVLPSFIFQDNSCIHPHEKQYAEKSFIESKVKRKKHIGTVNVRQWQMLHVIIGGKARDSILNLGLCVVTCSRPQSIRNRLKSARCNQSTTAVITVRKPNDGP